MKSSCGKALEKKGKGDLGKKKHGHLPVHPIHKGEKKDE